MKRFNLLCALSFWIVLSLIGFAMAADAVPPAAPNIFGDALAGFLTSTVFPVLGALALGIVSWAAEKIGTKFKIDSLTQDHNFLTQIAAQGVAFAEEKAANYAKAAKPLSGNEKLNAAIAYVIQMAPKVSEAQAQSLVTSALAMLPGVGATGAAAVGTPPPVVIPAPSAAIDPLAVAPA